MLFSLAKNSQFFQNLVIRAVTSIHPSIEHNIAKIQMIKKAFFHCELEAVEGSYFEFGVYEGSSLYMAVHAHKKLRSKFQRKFFGFDSFDVGFKYFDERDKHPFFREGDFKSSYQKTLKRFRKWGGLVSLIPGYFEDTVKDKNPKMICGDEACAILFIDCDLMGPALISLNFIRPILRAGSVIILDDYWAYKGDPERGTCGALACFLKSHPDVVLRDYIPYGYGGMSFVVSSLSAT